MAVRASFFAAICIILVLELCVYTVVDGRFISYQQFIKHKPKKGELSITSCNSDHIYSNGMCFKIFKWDGKVSFEV